MVTFNFVIQSLISGLLTGGTYGLMAIGFTLVFGVMRIINFAHGHLVVVASYITIVLFREFGLDPYLSLGVTVSVGFLLGMGMFKGILRRILSAPEAAQFTLTMGILIFFENLMLFLFGGELRGAPTWYTYQSIPLGGTVVVSVAKLLGFICTVVSVGVLYWVLRRTVFGKSIRAVADEREGALLTGINVERTFMLAFALSIGYAAIAGTTVVTYQVINPSSGLQFVLMAFMIVVLGGLGSIGGALVGGGIFGVVEVMATSMLPQTPSLALGIVLALIVLIIVVRPQGLLGRMER